MLTFELLQVFLYNATIDSFYKPNFWFAIVVTSLLCLGSWLHVLFEKQFQKMAPM
jgi:hypothetical protein